MHLFFMSQLKCIISIYTVKFRPTLMSPLMKLTRYLGPGSVFLLRDVFSLFYHIMISTGQYPIKFILPEFVSYLGERGVLCVGNGSHFCTPVLMNMCNITFQVLRLSTFDFNKCSEKNSHDYICGYELKGFRLEKCSPSVAFVECHVFAQSIP